MAHRILQHTLSDGTKVTAPTLAKPKGAAVAVSAEGKTYWVLASAPVGDAVQAELSVWVARVARGEVKAS